MAPAYKAESKTLYAAAERYTGAQFSLVADEFFGVTNYGPNMAAKFDSLQNLADDAFTTAERSATTAKYLSRFGMVGKYLGGPAIPIAVGVVELAKEPTCTKAFEVTGEVASWYSRRCYGRSLIAIPESFGIVTLPAAIVTEVVVTSAYVAAGKSFGNNAYDIFI